MGLLNLDGGVVLDADFDQTVRYCGDADCTHTRTRNGSPSRRTEARCSRRMVASFDATCGGIPPYTLKVGDKFGLVDAGSKP